jgi:sigma-B regulation protein RsbU (phosphoserine phosphatase)
MPQTDAIASLEKRLFLKERELGALLEITQVITQDSVEVDLYKIYQFTLIGQLGVRKLALYVLEEGVFWLKVNFGTALPANSRFALPEAMQWCPASPCPVEQLGLGDAWQTFELLVPVRHQGSVQALVFVGTTQSEQRGASFSRNAEQHPARGRGQPPASPPARGLADGRGRRAPRN